MLQLDDITTQDGYTDANTISDQSADLLSIGVGEADVYVQYRRYDPERQNELSWGDEVRLVAPLHQLVDGVAGIRVRSATPGKPAAVTAQLYEPSDVRPATSSGFVQVVTTLGQLGFQHGGVLQATEANLDLENTSTLAWTLTDDPANTRMKVQATVIGPVPSVYGRTGAVLAQAGDYSVAQVTGAAPLASPAFSGTPTAPTPPTVDSSTKIATTAYVQAQGYLTSAPVSTVFGRTGAVLAQAGDYTAAQVSNAADLSSVTAQVFSAPISTGPSTTNFATPGVYLSISQGVWSTVSSGTGLFGGALLGDAHSRIILDGSPSIRLGTGAVVADTIVGRIAAGVFGDPTTSLSTGPTSSATGGGGIDGVFLTPTGTVVATVAAITGDVFHGSVVGDSTSRFVVAGDGTLKWGAGSSGQDTTLARMGAGVIGVNGGLFVNGGSGLGYGGGAGGSVTQLTSKSTAVTLNQPTGRIVMSSAALAAGASVTFVLFNSTLGANDCVVCNPISTFTSYRADVTNSQAPIGSGRCSITVTNLSGGSLSEAVQLQFAVIKGAIT